jgi:anti-sigma factor RsiW
MTETTQPGDKHLLLQAAVDGELDAAGMLAFERSLGEDAELAAEYRRLLALREAFRGEAFRNLAKAPASPALRARVEALAAAEKPAPRRAPQPGGWRPAAIAAGLAFLLGGGLTALVLPRPLPDSTQTLVASHVRGVISGQLTDVISSDRHTVKPWFATRSVISPQVVDLASDGFPLVGGRLDVIGVTPVPTLVFRHGAHVVSLTEVPDSVAHLPTGHGSAEGFSVLYWQQGDATYVAISDAQAAELDAFAAAYRKATAAAP